VNATAEVGARPREPLPPAPARGRGADLRLALKGNRKLLFGAALALLYVVGGLVGLMLIVVPGFHHLYENQNLAQTLQPPLHGGLLGTDQLGRSLFWRVLAGMGVSFAVGVIVTVISLMLGGALGLLAGYFGGKLDFLLSGIIDITWGFPVILLAVMLSGVIAPGFWTVVLAIGLINWAGFARIIRGEVLSLRERDFVRSARALGAGPWWIMRRHLIPNVVPSTLVMAAYYLAIAIIAEAGLSFLALGVQPPTPSLGQLLADASDYLSIDEWFVIVPGIALILIVVGLNTLGDGLRDVLDPRLRVRG
jgi:ABC-type dipeptide/oligopeptide/nickel transport system permease subunit